MLVKLRDSWIDPAKVSGIDPVPRERMVEVVTSDGKYLLGGFADDNAVRAECDALAAIVNAALSTQSFGGDDDSAQKG